MPDKPTLPDGYYYSTISTVLRPRGQNAMEVNIQVVVCSCCKCHVDPAQLREHTKFCAVNADAEARRERQQKAEREQLQAETTAGARGT